MELYLAERLRKFRKDKDLTQDALAQVLGVSPQSVGKWECGDGYPDITLLPGIANYFGVSIDELLGNDKAGKETAKKAFYEKLNTLRDNEERLALAIEYHRKYPTEMEYMYSLCRDAGWVIARDEGKRKPICLCRRK